MHRNKASPVKYPVHFPVFSSFSSPKDLQCMNIREEASQCEPHRRMIYLRRMTKVRGK